MQDERFERLYDAHATPLLRFLMYRTGDRALAEDLVADTFERVLRARRRFDPRKSSEKTWIYTIALNCLRDHLRRRGAETRALERVTVPGEDPADRPSWHDAVDDRDALMRALEHLTEDERQAVALRYGADLTLAEIEKVLGESRGAVEGRLYRGLGKLREGLSP